MANQKKIKHGGKRKGAGRPKTKEPTKVMRVPVSLVEKFKKIIQDYLKASLTPLIK
jgi:hypothetical protein